MKKLITSIVAMLLAVATLFAIGCGKGETTVVETDDQLAALTEVQAGTSDIAVIDSVMANYYVNKPNFSDLTILTGEDFTFASEYYAIGARKNTNTATYINAALYSLQRDGKIDQIAVKYGLKDVLATIPTFDYESIPGSNEVDPNSDFGKILTKGKLVLGYTIFEPIAYLDGTTLIGFDIELAKAVCDYYKIQLETVKINWDTKEDELNAGNIDVIWNGFTYTDQRAEKVDFTNFYLTNRQSIVIRKADASKYTDYKAMKGATFACESESAGETTIREIILAKIDA